jgi:hypothetical protein
LGKDLSPDEREIAALALLEIDHAEQAGVDAAWDEEIGHRVDEAVSGGAANAFPPRGARASKASPTGSSTSCATAK